MGYPTLANKALANLLIRLSPDRIYLIFSFEVSVSGILKIVLARRTHTLCPFPRNDRWYIRLNLITRISPPSGESLSWIFSQKQLSPCSSWKHCSSSISPLIHVRKSRRTFTIKFAVLAFTSYFWLQYYSSLLFSPFWDRYRSLKSWQNYRWTHTCNSVALIRALFRVCAVNLRSCTLVSSRSNQFIAR